MRKLYVVLGAAAFACLAIPSQALNLGSYLEDLGRNGYHRLSSPNDNQLPSACDDDRGRNGYGGHGRYQRVSSRDDYSEPYGRSYRYDDQNHAVSRHVHHHYHYRRGAELDR